MIDKMQIEEIVREVIKRYKGADFGKEEVAPQFGIFDNLDDAVKAARAAQRKYLNLTLETKKKIIENIRKKCLEKVDYLSELAVSETGLGRKEDKKAKNRLAILKTPGFEDLEPICMTGDHGLTLQERAPFGVIGAVTPTTNPSETIINNSICAITAGNAIVFNPHPNAKKVSNEAVKLVNQAVISAFGPMCLAVSTREPTVDSAKKMFNHPDIDILLITGGPGVVRAAMQAGKRVIGAGPGNPPVVVDESADLKKAAVDIVLGSSLDNNVLCIAEKEVFVIDTIADKLISEFRNAYCYIASKEETDRLVKVCLNEKGHVNKKFVGKNAGVILKELGKSVDDSIRLIICETDRKHPFVEHELLMPVLPVVRVNNVEQAIAFAIEAEHGFKHTACMHSKNIENLHKMAQKVNTTIFVKNGPSCAGLGYLGEGYTSFSIAGTTGEGLTTPITFTRMRRCTLVDYFRIV